jgi:hypothetical protein
MKKTSLTRALFVAGMMAAAGTMAHADAIFYPDGTHVNLGENAVENGLAAQVLAQSPSTAPDSSRLASLGVSADQGQIFASNPMMDDTAVAYDSSLDTTSLGAGPAMTTTTVTTSPVYVFPNINFDPATVRSQHRMMGHIYGYNYTPADVAVVTPSTTIVDTTALGAGPADMTMLPPPVLVPDNSYNWWSDPHAPVGGPKQPDSASE